MYSFKFDTDIMYMGNNASKLSFFIKRAQKVSTRVDCQSRACERQTSSSNFCSMHGDIDHGNVSYVVEDRSNTLPSVVLGPQSGEIYATQQRASFVFRCTSMIYVRLWLDSLGGRQ